jgi:hypothetical protein
MQKELSDIYSQLWRVGKERDKYELFSALKTILDSVDSQKKLLEILGLK